MLVVSCYYFHFLVEFVLLISLYFTVIAVIRGFLVRRYYNNKKTKNKAKDKKTNEVDPMITAVKKTVDLLNGKK
jgi:hypothetical protein